MSRSSVPLSRPSISDEDVELVVSTLKSGWLAHGAFNEKLEQAFCDLLGVPHAVSMNSCTSALQIALLANRIRGEVVVPSFTWVATANAVVTSGATPVFCEVDPVTRNMTAETIAPQITPRTEALVVVHFGGQPCSMDDIVALCRRHGLLLIEDSAETLGATWRGRQAGSIGIGCFSFFPTKNITTGEGGVFTCHDDALARTVRGLISHGIVSTTFEREKTTRPWLRAAEMAGFNFRMPNPLAALGYGQMMRLDALNGRRIALAARYDRLLAERAPGVDPPAVAEDAAHVYQMYTVRVDAGRRDAVVNGLRERGIGASVHFDPPVHLQPYYVEHHARAGQLPATERLAAEIVTLPLFPDMTEAEQDLVVDRLVEVMEQAEP